MKALLVYLILVQENVAAFSPTFTIKLSVRLRGSCNVSPIHARQSSNCKARKTADTLARSRARAPLDRKFSGAEFIGTMPVMVLLKGYPGSGKSSLSRCLSRRLQWPIIDKDDAKDILMTQHGCPMEKDANALSYSIMLRTAATQLECGLSVIVDCPLAYLELYNRALAIANKEGATIVVVECACKNHDVWKRRLGERVQAGVEVGKVHKPQTWEEIEASQKRYDGCDAWPKDVGPHLKWLVLDTSRITPAEGCQTVCDYLAANKLVDARISPEDPVFLNSA